MPIYEYKCSKCNKIIEEYDMASKESIRCPICGNNAGKIVSKASVIGDNIGSKNLSKIKGLYGSEIDNRSDMKRYVNRHGGTFISKSEWKEMKDKWLSPREINVQQYKRELIEDIKRYQNSEEERAKLKKEIEERHENYLKIKDTIKEV